MQIPSIPAEAWAKTVRNLNPDPFAPIHKRVFGECLTMGLDDGVLDEGVVQTALQEEDTNRLCELTGQAVRHRLGVSSKPEDPRYTTLFSISTDIPSFNPDVQPGSVVLEHSGFEPDILDFSMEALTREDPNKAQDVLLVLAVLERFFPGLQTGSDVAHLACDMDELAMEFSDRAHNRLSNPENATESILDGLRDEWEDACIDIVGERPDDEMFEHVKTLYLLAHAAPSALYEPLFSLRADASRVDAMFEARHDRGGSELDALVERAHALWLMADRVDEERSRGPERVIPYSLGAGLLVLDTDQEARLKDAAVEVADSFLRMDMEAGEDRDAVAFSLEPQRWGETLDVLRHILDAKSLLHDLAVALRKIDEPDKSDSLSP